MKKLLTSIVLGAGLLALAACSTTKPNGAEISDGTPVGSGASMGANGEVVVTSGAGDSNNFGSADDAKSMQVGNQKYYFGFDNYDVNNDDLPSIKVQANYLATHPEAKILLAGNTDERGSREYNIALGNKRAQSVAAALEANGVNKDQITTVSYGAEKPVAFRHDEDSWAKNRRVDLIYQTPITINK